MLHVYNLKNYESVKYLMFLFCSVLACDLNIDASKLNLLNRACMYVEKSKNLRTYVTCSIVSFMILQIIFNVYEKIIFFNRCSNVLKCG